MKKEVISILKKDLTFKYFEITEDHISIKGMSKSYSTHKIK